MGWESLADRCWGRRILQIHKIINKNTPNYLNEILPCCRRPCRPLYRVTNYNIYHEIACNSDRYKNSFTPDGIRNWNIVIRDFPVMPSINNLKKHLLSLIRPTKKTFFNILDPSGVRYLFLLRLGLSPLRKHMHNHEFKDIFPNCLCNQGVEDSNHFLFSCPLFAVQRVVLTNSVHEILQRYNLINLSSNTHLYLYGDSIINVSDNKLILLSTIKFIKDSHRFST